MKVTYKGKFKVLIEMTERQLEAITSIHESFTDQVDESNNAYGDAVKAANKLTAAIGRAKRLRGDFDNEP